MYHFLNIVLMVEKIKEENVYQRINIEFLSLNFRAVPGCMIGEHPERFAMTPPTKLRYTAIGFT